MNNCYRILRFVIYRAGNIWSSQNKVELRLMSIWRSLAGNCSWSRIRCLRSWLWIYTKRSTDVRWKQVSNAPVHHNFYSSTNFSLVNMLANPRHWWRSLLANEPSSVSDEESRSSEARAILPRWVLRAVEWHSRRCSTTSKYREFTSVGSSAIAFAAKHRAVEKKPRVEFVWRRTTLRRCCWRWLWTRFGSRCATGKIQSWVKEH